jgi:hypothetical protein
VPVGELSIEGLRLLIGQRIGLPHLVPLAVEVLCDDPLAEGDYYPGDLLKNVLDVDPAIWRERPELKAALAEALRRVRTFPGEVAARVATFLAAR